MSNFLAPDNVCGQNLLKLVSRGSTILAELQRLSENIPKSFYDNSENAKYKNILFDFEYFKQIDNYEDKIQQNPELLDLDEYFKNNYKELLIRFYIVFESIYLYYSDIKNFIEQIFEGVFMQFTYDDILQDTIGKQLITEAFYLYGTMLLLMDRLIIGPVRERIIVAYCRCFPGYQGQDHINEIIKLTRNTGFIPAQHNNGVEKRPQYYPEDLFDRFGFKFELIDQIIIAIKEGDIYKHKSAYPQADHRSFALATQAQMIYVLLFFVPEILNTQKAKMRQIVDKHFYDNWVIAFYLGYTVDLTNDWIPYEAAKQALANTLDIEFIEKLSKYYNDNLRILYDKCEDYLTEGTLNEEFILDKLNQLLVCLRESNITVRWLMLHRNTTHKKLKDICSQAKKREILALLLISSKFEDKFKDSLQKLIAQKQEKWDLDKLKCCKRMDELAKFFGSTQQLGDFQGDEGFKEWFEEMQKQIEQLNYGDSTYIGRKVKQLIEALDDIEQYDQVARSIQIKQYLYDTKKDLRHMMRIVNIKEEYLTNISLISDVTYSWQSLQDGYIQIMQDKIKKDPSLALLLKTTFMKLSSILNTPMVRIVQCESNDLISVSKFYSGLLINFVKDVLQIIPISVFTILESIIEILTKTFKSLPPKIKKEQLKEYIQSEDRAKISQCVQQISLFTESILSMEKYLIGVIEVNPKQILDDGIRKELLKLIAKQLDQRLIFNNGDINTFINTLTQLSSYLTGFKRSLEYIQDFIGNYGLRIFHEEFDKLILSYIDMEQIAFITKKLDYEELLYDSCIPMPDRQVMEKHNSVNFMGRILKEMMKLTDFRTTVYIHQNIAFYQYPKGQEMLNIKILNMLYKCIGVSGLNGLDQLLSFMIASSIKTLIRTIKNYINSDLKNQMTEIFNQIKDLNAFSDKYYQNINQIRKVFKNLSFTITDPIQKIGQMVLLRKIICVFLQVISKVGSNRLFEALNNLNNAVINDLTNRQYTDIMNTEEIQQKENKFLYETSKLFTFVGLSDPIRKIYCTTEPFEGISLIMFALTLNTIQFIDYDNKLKCLIKRTEKLAIEPNYIINGIIVFLNQFNKEYDYIYQSLISYYVKSTLNFFISSKEQLKNYPEQLSDFFTLLKYYEEYLYYQNKNEIKYKINPILPIELINQMQQYFYNQK